MRPKQPVAPKERNCHLCANALDELDYKDVRLMQRFVSAYGKILPRRRTGTCVKHQRVVTQAVKRARIMALLPFVIQ
jgi:small subunit ribosomal protein S18